MTLSNGGWFIGVSLAIAVLLTTVRMPNEIPSWFQHLRPDWLLLTLYFWSLRFPDRMNILLVWLFGFVVDVLMNEPLGTNPLCFIILVFTCRQMQSRFDRQHTGETLLLLLAILGGLLAVKALILAFAYDVVFDILTIVGKTVSSILWWFVIGSILDRVASRLMDQK